MYIFFNLVLEPLFIITYYFICSYSLFYIFITSVTTLRQPPSVITALVRMMPPVYRLEYISIVLVHLDLKEGIAKNP